MKKIGYLGPKGTFSYEAVLQYIETVKQDFELVPYVTIPEVMLGVDKGVIDKGIIPIENSIEGAVVSVLDTFTEDINITIESEFILSIREYLLGKADFHVDFSSISEVLSHPQPLGQCKKYINEKFNNAKIKAVSSTTAAIEEVLHGDGTSVAIGSIAATSIYKLKILDSNIQDEDNNSTRFVVVSKEKLQRTTNEKTSVIFSTTDESGSLYKILSIFNIWNLNLARIESRPSKKKLGEYLFFVDIVGQYDEQDLIDSLEMVKRKSSYFKFLGSYSQL